MGKNMRIAQDVALELKLLFAKLFETDAQIEELERLILEKSGAQSRVDEHVSMGGLIHEQRGILERVKILSREYWKAL